MRFSAPQNVTLKLIGQSGQIDGYAETIIGLFSLSGVLLELPKATKNNLENDQVELVFELLLAPSPLGNLGDD